MKRRPQRFDRLLSPYSLQNISFQVVLNFRTVLRKMPDGAILYCKAKKGMEKEVAMAVSYNRLWKLLVDKKMSKADLRRASGVAPNTMTKLRRDEEVTLTVLGKICKALDADYGDIMEYVDKGDE